MRYTELITENDDDLFGAEPTKQGRTAQRSIDYARHRPRKNSTAQYYLVAPDQDIIARATADKTGIDKLEHYARGYAQRYIDDGYTPDDTMQVVFRKLNQGMEDTVVARVWPLSRLVGLHEDEDDDLFGAPTKAGKQTAHNIAVAQFAANLHRFAPELQHQVAALTGQAIQNLIRDIVGSLPGLRGDPRLQRLVTRYFTVDGQEYAVRDIFDAVSEDPNAALDENARNDMLIDIVSSLRYDSDLWDYLANILENMGEEEDEDTGELTNMEDIEFELASDCEGHMQMMLEVAMEYAILAVSRIEEDLDDAELFGTQPTGHRLPPGHKFVIYINNQPRGKAVDLENAVDRSERYLAAVHEQNPDARVNIQIVDDHDGEVMWSGAAGRGSTYYRGGASKYAKIDEAPLADYQPMGDFDKPGPFRGVDKKLVPHPTNQLKTARFFEQTPYDFRLFFSNIPGTGKYSEYGPMRAEVIQQVFGANAQQILAGSEDAITVVFVGNKGDSKVMLTPWMMAHRIGHAVQAGERNTAGTWRAAEEHFFRAVNGMLQDFYGKRGQRQFSMSNDLSKEYAALFNAIGTQRSSRTGQITRPYEFLYELFAQYLGTGKIELKPLPKSQGYGRKAWGRSTQSLNLRGNEEESQYSTEVLGRDMELMFDDVLSSLVGKILVM